MSGYGRRTLGLSVVVGLIGLVGPSSASAATQIGETFAPDATDCSNIIFLQSGSPGGEYAVPVDGVITSWSHQASATPVPLRFKVARAEGGSSFTIVAEDPVAPAPAVSPAPNALNTYLTRIPVQAGQVIGFFWGGAVPRPCSRPAAGYSWHIKAGDLPPGTTQAFVTEAGRQIDLSATLEPDCDSDGFGDETQDPFLDPVGCDRTPPETTITQGPNDKTKKKTATFEFTANEPGATFECSLDGAAFATCTSPDTLKVKKGRHSFSVRAQDAGGNVDASPASDDWKVKRKKRK